MRNKERKYEKGSKEIEVAKMTPLDMVKKQTSSKTEKKLVHSTVPCYKKFGPHGIGIISDNLLFDP